MENAALEMIKLTDGHVCLMLWSTSAEIPKLCITGGAKGHKSCCQAGQAAFPWSVVFDSSCQNYADTGSCYWIDVLSCVTGRKVFKACSPDSTRAVSASLSLC